MPTSTFLQPRLDAPDKQVRMIQLKRTQGQPMNRRDLGRLATRMSVEEATLENPQGGQVQKMLPREQDPGAAYAKGYEGARRLFQQPAGTAARTGLTPAGPAAASAPTTGMRRALPAPSAIIGGKSYPTAPSTQPSANIGGKDYDPIGEPDDDADDTTAPAPTQQIGAPPIPAGNSAITAPPNPQALQQSALPATPTTSNAPQTESNNPLSGDGNKQPAGTSAPIDPARALGFSHRGAGVPQGQDAMPEAGHVGGSGLYARKFASPASADIYSGFVRRLFGTRTT